jgi:hypothetical protein
MRRSHTQSLTCRTLARVVTCHHVSPRVHDTFAAPSRTLSAPRRPDLSADVWAVHHVRLPQVHELYRHNVSEYVSFLQHNRFNAVRLPLSAPIVAWDRLPINANAKRSPNAPTTAVGEACALRGIQCPYALPMPTLSHLRVARASTRAPKHVRSVGRHIRLAARLTCARRVWPWRVRISQVHGAVRRIHRAPLPRGSR